MMQLPDLLNGTFQLIGGMFLLLDVQRLHRDKVLSGVHWLPRLWFMAWGYFNIYYYPHLGQILSFCGGLMVVSANTLWLSLYMWYGMKRVWLSPTNT